MESSKSKLAYTKASYERMQEAVKTKAISEIDYLQAQSDYGEALAAYEEARSQLSLANIDLSYCIVKAPFTGRIDVYKRQRLFKPYDKRYIRTRNGSPRESAKGDRQPSITVISTRKTWN